jgi:phosphoenolpyruvate synthase/pyruvate phosphate dikinase
MTMPDCVDIKKVFLSIKAYSKRILATKFESVGAKLKLPKNRKTANMFHGLPVSPGVVAGISHVLGRQRKKSRFPIILVADSARYAPDDFDLLVTSSGAVTTNTGMTGHIPVNCRGLGIGCVVLAQKVFSQIRNGDKISLCGTTGRVATGVLVDLSHS